MFETIELLSVLDELPTHILNHLRQPLLKRVCDNVNDLPELTAMENNLLINECCILLGFRLLEFVAIKAMCTGFTFDECKASACLEFYDIIDSNVDRLKEFIDNSKLVDIVRYENIPSVGGCGNNLVMFFEEEDNLSINAQLIYLLEIIFSKTYVVTDFQRRYYESRKNQL